MDERAPSPHDLMPLDLAAETVFRRVYEKRAHMRPGAGRPLAHFDGLAYTIAEMGPIYVYESDGRGVRPLSAAELAGGLFQEGARALTYVDGRAPVRHLAVSVRHVEAVIATLIEAAGPREDG